VIRPAALVPRLRDFCGMSARINSTLLDRAAKQTKELDRVAARDLDRAIKARST
jgi:hypothetical protein